MTPNMSTWALTADWGSWTKSLRLIPSGPVAARLFFRETTCSYCWHVILLKLHGTGWKWRVMKAVIWLHCPSWTCWSLIHLSDQTLSSSHRIALSVVNDLSWTTTSPCWRLLTSFNHIWSWECMIRSSGAPLQTTWQSGMKSKGWWRTMDWSSCANFFYDTPRHFNQRVNGWWRLFTTILKDNIKILLTAFFCMSDSFTFQLSFKVTDELLECFKHLHKIIMCRQIPWDTIRERNATKSIPTTIGRTLHQNQGHVGLLATIPTAWRILPWVAGLAVHLTRAWILLNCLNHLAFGWDPMIGWV